MRPITPSPSGIEGSRYIFNILDDDFTRRHLLDFYDQFSSRGSSSFYNDSFFKSTTSTTTNNNQHLSNVKYLRNDHGSESLNTELENFLTPQEIEHQLAVPRPPPPPPTRITRMALLNHPIKYYNNLLAIYLLMPWYQNHSGFLLLLLLTLMLPCFVTFVHCWKEGEWNANLFKRWFLHDFDHSLLLLVWGLLCLCIDASITQTARNKMCVFLDLISLGYSLWLILYLYVVCLIFI